MRRVSEPPEEILSPVTSSGTPHAPFDRRRFFDRHWSTSNLTTNNTAVRGFGRPPSASQSRYDLNFSIADMSEFQKSWVNTTGEDLFGSSTPCLVSSAPTSMDFGGVIDVPSVPLRSSFSPRVDSSSLIHDAARITDWDQVLRLCKSNPEYARYTGADGWTALHHACNRRCPRPEVVQALIEAYPDALSTEEEKGWLPLHYACRFKCIKEVVHLLLHSYPEKGKAAVAKKDNQGRQPLYYAIRYDAPPGVVGLLLAVNPAAVLEGDQNDESPLALVWDNWAEKLEARRIIHSFMPGGFPEPKDTTEQQRTELLRNRLERQTKLLKRWRQVNVLLKAAFGFPIEEASWDAMDFSESMDTETNRKWRVLHAAAAVKCHVSLFLLACALHPEQARELDENDLKYSSDPMLSGVSTHQTAMHLAASSPVGGEAGKTVVHRLLALYREAAHIQDAVDGSLPFHLIVENKHKMDWANHAAILYHVYPRAVRVPDHHGRLPLHRACAAITHQERDEEYFETSVIMNVLQNNPGAASHVDNNGCLPFHHLAMNAILWDDEVEAVYNANRGAAQVRASAALENRLPLHMASARKESQASLISRIVQSHPRAASTTDRTGKLPLHLACEAGKDWGEGVSTLCEAYPDGIRQAEDNSRGWLPLHIVAFKADSSRAVVAKMVELYPESVEIPDSEGNYPLHLACDAGKLWKSGVDVIFDQCQGVLSSANNAGLLPFHIVALKYCGSDGALEEDEREIAELDTMFRLLVASPTGVLGSGSSDPNPPPETAHELRRVHRFDLPSLLLESRPAQHLTLQNLEEIFEKGVDRAEKLGYPAPIPIEYKLNADVVWTNARRPLRPLETFLGVAEQTESEHVWETSFALHCWQMKEFAATEGGVQCPYPQPHWLEGKGDIADCGRRPIHWIDLSGNSDSVLFPTTRSVLYMLRSVLGTDHGVSPWSSDKTDTPDTVILAVDPNQVRDEQSRLNKFRVSDASPSWALHAVVPSWVPCDQDNLPTLSKTAVSLLIYRRLPPRDCLSRVHPVTQEVVPVESCLWETIIPKTSKEDAENDNDEPAGVIHRLVSPPYVDASVYYAKEVQILLENIEVIRSEAALIAHWTAWPEQQHYQAAAETSDGGAPWNVFPLCYCFPANDVSQRQWIPMTTAVVPNTSRILRMLGDKLRTALFSRLDAGARLEAHTGWEDLANHVLRLHIPLDIPPGNLCGTWVDGCVMTHQSDAAKPWICFDDSKTHRAFNYAAQARTVLILDLERPAELPPGTATGGHTEELENFIAQMSSPR